MSGIQPCFARSVDDLRFTTSCWYSDIDLRALQREVGQPFFRKPVFHIAAYGAGKLGSLAPERFDLGPFADFAGDACARLWCIVVRQI